MPRGLDWFHPLVLGRRDAEHSEVRCKPLLQHRLKLQAAFDIFAFVKQASALISDLFHSFSLQDFQCCLQCLFNSLNALIDHMRRRAWRNAPEMTGITKPLRLIGIHQPTSERGMLKDSPNFLLEFTVGLSSQGLVRRHQFTRRRKPPRSNAVDARPDFLQQSRVNKPPVAFSPAVQLPMKPFGVRMLFLEASKSPRLRISFPCRDQ